jgi:hypothetical protein
VTINTALLAVAAYFTANSYKTALILALVGLVVNYLWYRTIEYYRKLNQAKFIVIHEIEDRLPFRAFRREDEEFLKLKCDRSTKTESLVAWVFVALFLIVVALTVLGWAKVISW